MRPVKTSLLLLSSPLPQVSPLQMHVQEATPATAEIWEETEHERDLHEFHSYDHS